MKKRNFHKGVSPEMVRYTNPGIAREMSTANLNSGQPYQRPVKPSDVNALIRRWDPAYLSPIEVSFRDGSYNVINGQHRIEAMRKMNGGADVIVPCLIYTGLSYEQEAAMYYLLDKPTGVTYEIKPVRAIISAYHLLGSRAFSRMLGLLAGAWHGTQNSLTAGMISGVALFLKAHENELEDYEFIRRLSEVDPVEIIQLAQVESPALRYARLIRTKYNEQGAKMLPDRFKS